MPLSEKQLRAVRQASAGRDVFASRVDWELWVGGRDITHLTEECDYGCEDAAEGNGAVTLTALVRASLPRTEMRARVEVRWVVYGDESTEVLKRFVGRVYGLKALGDSTELLAATAGFAMPTTPLAEPPPEETPRANDVSFVGSRPDVALYAAMIPCGYDGFDLPRVGSPLYYAAGEDGYSWADKCSDLAGAVREQTGLAARDYSDNRAGAMVSGLPAGSSGAVGDPSGAGSVWTFTEGVDVPAGQIAVEEIAERHYYEVLACKEFDDGTVTVVGRARVDTGEVVVPRSSKFVVFVDEESEESGFQLARREAEALAHDRAKLSFPLEYVPLHLDRGSAVTVLARNILPLGDVEQVEYAGELAAYEYDAAEKAATVVVSARRTARRRLTEREAFGGGGRVEGAGPRRPAWGLSFAAEPEVDVDEVAWAEFVEGDEVEIDVETGPFVADEDGEYEMLDVVGRSI